jgi:hypothetical protein
MLNPIRADHKTLRFASPLTGLIVLAAALGACGETDVSKLLLPQAAPRCTEAFRNDRSASFPTSGSVKGPAAAFQRHDDSQIEKEYRRYANSTWEKPFSRIIPKHAQTISADAVRAVICLQSIYTRVGTYEITDFSAPVPFPISVPGAREDWDVRVIRWPSSEPVAAKVFLGKNPSVGKTSARGGTFVSGLGPWSSEVEGWLEGVITP